MATRPDPISPSAIAGGVRLEPVKGSRPFAWVVGEGCGPVVGDGTRLVDDVEPRPVTGVVGALVAGIAVVGVVRGTVDVGTVVVVDATVEGLVLLEELDDTEAVVIGPPVEVVVAPVTQLEKVSCACAEPPPSEDDHELLACTTCVPAPRLSGAVSPAFGLVIGEVACEHRVAVDRHDLVRGRGGVAETLVVEVDLVA